MDFDLRLLTEKNKWRKMAFEREQQMLHPAESISPTSLRAAFLPKKQIP
jgi:hypothetical protein